MGIIAYLPQKCCPAWLSGGQIAYNHLIWPALGGAAGIREFDMTAGENKPLVTVVVSCYNHEAYVRACIESILRQDYPRIELIVVDDGSSDRSAEVIAELAAVHGFDFRAQANQGLAATLNAAIARATGKYVCPMGSDDIMLPDKTSKQVDLMESEPDIAVCGGNALVIDGCGQIVDRRQSFPPRREISFEQLFTNSAPGIVAPTAMIRRDVFLREGGYDPAIPLEDMYLWLKLTHRGYRMVGMNDVLIYYRKHASNTYKNVAHMSDSLRKTYRQYADHPAYPQVINRYLNSAFLNACKTGDGSLALELLRQISPRYYSWKIPRGLARLLFARRD